MKYTTIVLAVVVGCAVAVVPAQQPTVLANPIECEICKLFEPEFASLAGQEKNVVESKLNAICDKIPLHELAIGCEAFIDKEIDNIVAALKNDPSTVCTEIHACSEAVVEVVEPAVSRAARVQQAKIDPECLLCHLLGPTLESLAGKEEPVIQKKLDTICIDVLQRLDHHLMDTCVNFINKEGAMIAKVLSEDNGSGAKMLCEKIKMCPASLVEAKVDNLSNVFECDICKALGPQLEKLAGKEETVIIKELDTVCDKLSFFKKGCEAYINKEGAKIAKVLAEDEGSSAHVLCDKLHMCSSAFVEAEPVKVENSNHFVECEICKALGPELEALAGKEEGVVVKDLEGICKKLPEIFRGTCESWISKEGAKIAKILSEDSGSGAHVLCQKLGMCSSALVEESKIDIKCFICKELGPELEKLAKKEEGVVAKDLEHICDKIPLVGKDCDKFIQKEAVMIAKVLTEDEGSKAHVLCEKIGWC